MEILNSGSTFDVYGGTLRGAGIVHSTKLLSELGGIFADREAYEAMDPRQVVYEVTSHMAVPEGKAGGLFFGISRILPGTVGNEYFMTKGHFHANRDTAEYYFGISGTGVLLLMDEAGGCTAQEVEKGSLHYIGGNIAHRLVNTGGQVLVVGACWPSDAGHNYENIHQSGFPVRVMCTGGKPALVKAGEYAE
jgi:glucose-6-phosphate isomerase